MKIEAFSWVKRSKRNEWASKIKLVVHKKGNFSLELERHRHSIVKRIKCAINSKSYVLSLYVYTNMFRIEIVFTYMQYDITTIEICCIILTYLCDEGCYFCCESVYISLSGCTNNVFSNGSYAASTKLYLLPVPPIFVEFQAIAIQFQLQWLAITVDGVDKYCIEYCARILTTLYFNSVSPVQ